jgi:hypothetical protein
LGFPLVILSEDYFFGAFGSCKNQSFYQVIELELGSELLGKISPLRTLCPEGILHVHTF